jgi:sugar phosphate isomerase/epimerase
MIKLGIFAKTFVGSTPLEVLGAAAECGYASVQYNMACSGIGALPEIVTAEIAEAVRAASAVTGVEIAAISATYNMIHPDLSKREAGRRSFVAIAERAASMGSSLLTVCSGSCNAQDQWSHHPDNQSPDAWRAMLGEFETLIEIAETQDIFIGVEPELANVVDGAAKARALIDTLGSPRIRIVLDPANLFEIGTPETSRHIIAGAVDLLADRINMAHAKDRNADGSFATAGKGVIDFDHFVGCLNRNGFDGSLVTHGLAAQEADGVAAFFEQVIARQAVD